MSILIFIFCLRNNTYITRDTRLRRIDEEEVRFACSPQKPVKLSAAPSCKAQLDKLKTFLKPQWACTNFSSIMLEKKRWQTTEKKSFIVKKCSCFVLFQSSLSLTGECISVSHKVSVLDGKISAERRRRVCRQIVFATQSMVRFESHVSLNFRRTFLGFIVNRFTAVGQKCLGPSYRFDKVLPSSDVWTSDWESSKR